MFTFTNIMNFYRGSTRFNAKIRRLCLCGRTMIIIGLTGNIGSGKSTVAHRLRKLGAKIIDADQVAREVVLPGAPALREIAEHFG